MTKTGFVSARLTNPVFIYHYTFIKKVAGECGIFPITSGTETIQVNLHTGEYGNVFSAIDCGAHGGKIVIPFDRTDIITGEEY